MAESNPNVEFSAFIAGLVITDRDSEPGREPIEHAVTVSGPHAYRCANVITQAVRGRNGDALIVADAVAIPKPLSHHLTYAHFISRADTARHASDRAVGADREPAVLVGGGGGHERRSAEPATDRAGRPGNDASGRRRRWQWNDWALAVAAAAVIVMFCVLMGAIERRNDALQEAAVLRAAQASPTPTPLPEFVPCDPAGSCYERRIP